MYLYLATFDASKFFLKATVQGRWKVVAEGGLKPPIKILSPLQPPPLQIFITRPTVHPTALQRWLMASLFICFFSSLIPPNQRTNFCNCVTKVKKSPKLFDFLRTSRSKLLELYHGVAVKFSPILKQTFGQITAKQQDAKLELASLS